MTVMLTEMQLRRINPPVTGEPWQRVFSEGSDIDSTGRDSF